MLHTQQNLQTPKSFGTQQNRKASGMRRFKGFSLIEVMVSSALLVIAITGTLSAFSSATRVYEHQRKTTYAITIAESTLEDLLMRFQGDNQTKVSGAEYGPHCYSRDGKFLKDASSSTCPGGTYYEVSWLSSQVGTYNKVIRLGVTVRWEETQGQKTIQLSTLRN